MSIKLAKKIDSVIISADASQIYKELDIGTAKITSDEMQGIQHYMIDIINPDEDYSVGDFEKTVNNIKELLKKGYSYDIAKYIKIDIEPYALEYLQSNLLKNPYIMYDISKKENMEKLVLLVEKRLPLEKMKGFPTDKINFKYEEFTVLDVAVRTLENFEGIGKNLIICALNSPYENVRYGAANTLEKWKGKGYILPNEIIENIENLEKIEVDDELKEKLNKLVK